MIACHSALLLNLYLYTVLSMSTTVLQTSPISKLSCAAPSARPIKGQLSSCAKEPVAEMAADTCGHTYLVAGKNQGIGNDHVLSAARRKDDDFGNVVGGQRLAVPADRQRRRPHHP